LASEKPHTVEQKASRVLAIGVWTSAALMAVGLLLSALRGFRVSVPARTPTIPQILQQVGSLELGPVSLLYLGLLALMLTPVLRVISALLGFASEHDRKFTAVSLIILLLLAGEIAYSLLLSTG
jgi:uncharacterized membrane protein